MKKATVKKKAVNKITIAVCMIVKNEEAMLERALKSISECDNIYILDTGSIDNTVSIAKKYTKNVFLDFVWTDDFSAAQNHLLEKVRGKESWILSLDADEFLNVPFSEVRRAVSLAKEDMIYVEMIAEGSHRLQFGFGRLFRNSPKIYWEQAAHKHLNLPGDGEKVADLSIVFGRSPAHDNDPDRTLRILEHDVADKRKRGMPLGRELYYLGREYWYKQRNDEACTTLGEYIQVSRWPAEKAESYLIMSMAYSKQGLDDDARDACLQAICINPNFKEAIEWMAGIVKPEHAAQWRRMARTANNKDVMWDRVPASPVNDIIFLATHNDDESLFGAYTLIRHKPLVIIITDGWIQHMRGDKGCGPEARKKETIDAMKLACCPVLFMGIPDEQLTEEALRERLRYLNPETVYIPAYHENGNEQHNLVNKVALEIFGRNKCEQYCSYVKGDFNIVQGGWEITPTYQEMELKNKMLDCYKSQLALPSTRPHFEAVKNKSEWLV